MSTPATNDPAPVHNEVEAKNVENAVIESFLTSDVQNMFEVQTNNITTHTRMLAERFRMVKDRFENIDKRGSDEPLAPTWIGLRDRYLQFIQSSETIAAGIAAAANKHLAFVIKPAAGFHQKGEISATELEDLNVEIQDLLLDATELRNKFASLVSDARIFRDRIVSDKFGAARLLGNEQKIEELAAVVHDLEAKLDKFPTSLFGTLTEAILKDIRDRKDEDEKIHDENSFIISTRSALKGLGDHELEDVIVGLEFLRELWAAITVDCHVIEEYMMEVQSRKKLMDDKGRKTAPDNLVQYLRNTATLYHGMSRGLYLYGMGIREARNAGDLST
ncbi:hypothetical protein FRC20_010966 [Serendipita sp. 405]|nr:hypothetical protein FRC20_010966 [Serendipita sp. 405]